MGGEATAELSRSRHVLSMNDASGLLETVRSVIWRSQVLGMD